MSRALTRAWCGGGAIGGEPAVITVRQMAGQGLKHGDADRDAHFDLLADEASRVVGDGGVDLDAAVHRTGMHDERVRLGAGQLLGVEAEEVEIFALARDEARGHALALQAQHHDDVGVLQALAHGGEDLDAEPLDAGGEQGGGRDDADARAERVEEQDVGAGDAACRMSPQIATIRPSMRPLWRRMVSASSRACVGCSWLPSPALITEQSTFWARSSTAPAA